MRFVMTVHPGRECGEWDDGSFCFTKDGAHFWVPAPNSDVAEWPEDWAAGWADAGYTTDEDGGAPTWARA